jgi:hypothetical protein
MTPSDIKIVADFYTTGGLADYSAFLRDIDDAIRVLPTPLPSPRRAALSPDKILNTLKALFAERRISPRALFPAGPGRIARYVFERIVGQTATILTPDELAALSAAFGSNNEVDYEAFCAAFDAPRPEPDGITPIATSITSTLASHGLQLRPELNKFDRTKSDDLPPTSLIIALQNSSIVIGTPGIDALVRAFPGTARGSVSISRLCDVIDPQAPSPAAPPSPPPASAPRVLPAPSPSNLALVAHVGQAAASLGVDLEDWLRHGRVSDAQWRTIIGLLNRRFGEPALRTVSGQYAVPEGFDYTSFCRDCATKVTPIRSFDHEDDDDSRRVREI